MAIKLIIFDCDGTIVDTSMVHAQASSMALKALGIDIQPQELLDLTAGMDGRTAFEFLRTHPQHGFSADADFAAFKTHADANFLNALHQIHADSLCVEGFPTFFDMAESRNCIFAAASNGAHHNVMASLERVGYAQRFHSIVVGAQVARPKPAPDMLLHIIEQAAQQGIRPHEIAFFGDTMADVHAGKAAGLTVYTVIGAFKGTAADKANLKDEMHQHGAHVFENYFDALCILTQRPAHHIDIHKRNRPKIRLAS
ncbi:MAG: HAD family phosphatase [Alphaproteobacteria bacterium]|nr:HAD family phosphatase [Alphaproteobacteria bacterium]